ncbi:DnaJ homolog subfamily B member 6 [Fistulifera solaris]|uniref:DnaJ homolog subfamily B member 6 n=1 Tax=Fistulifera solaris TaxID=1519565 RepID=A0A1Z5K7L1_FISSO|nr:DnaJ homolog subfamily B member 6 [Fistulifera solaris]|eukprot:GAX22219.1 DnaJ homolog subfamily B member 6 [Fistulifera solaris]
MKLQQQSLRLFWLLLFLTFLSSHGKAARHANFSAKDDYYDILGVSKKANAKDIKAAYRKLALKYHPDKVPDDEKEKAEEIFVKVSEAYSILSDDDKRKVYDQYGKQGLEMMERGIDPNAGGFGSAGGGFGAGGGQTYNFKFNAGSAGGHTFQFDPFSMFQEMFGAGGMGGFESGNFKVHFDGFDGAQFGGGGARPGKPKAAAPKVDLFKDVPNVTRLGKPKYPNEKSKYLWLVVFYDYQHPRSEKAKGPIETLASKISGSYKIGAMNCGRNKDEANFCLELGIDLEDLPQFAFVVAGQHTFYDDSSKLPNARQLHEFVTQNMPTDNIRNINSVEHLQERLIEPLLHPSNEKHDAAILLLSDKYETGAMFASVAYQHRDKFLFGESRAKNLVLAKEFDLKRYPLLLAFVPAGHGDEEYNDEVDLVRFHNHPDLETINKWIDRLHTTQSTLGRRRRQRRKKAGHDEF